LLRLYEAVAAAPADMADSEFDALSDSRLDVQADYIATGSPGAQWLAEQIWAGIDVTVDRFRAVASLDGAAA
jgi:hypothetical protein